MWGDRPKQDKDLPFFRAVMQTRCGSLQNSTRADFAQKQTHYLLADIICWTAASLWLIFSFLLCLCVFWHKTLGMFCLHVWMCAIVCSLGFLSFIFACNELVCRLNQPNARSHPADLSVLISPKDAPSLLVRVHNRCEEFFLLSLIESLFKLDKLIFSKINI